MAVTFETIIKFSICFGFKMSIVIVTFLFHIKPSTTRVGDLKPKIELGSNGTNHKAFIGLAKLKET